MSIYTGNNSKIGFALESAWGTKVAPLTNVLSFVTESLKQERSKKQEDNQTGQAVGGRMDSMGVKTSGDINCLARPNEIGLLVAAAMGQESSTLAVNSASTVYDHNFICVPAGSACHLPALTIVVNEGGATTSKAFVSSKIANFKLDGKVQDYVRMTLTTRGHSQVESTGVVIPALTTSAAYKFSGATISAGGTAIGAKVKGFTFELDNGLEDNLFTANGSETMEEIEPTKRNIKLTLDCNWDDTIEGIRSSYFVADSPLSVVLTLTAGEAVTGVNYSLTITIPAMYISDDPRKGVSGPERLSHTLNLVATYDGVNQPLTIKVRDKKLTAYLS